MANIVKSFLNTVPRVLLGLTFLIGSIDGFWFIFSGSHLLHPSTTDAGLAFESALKAAGFFWPLMKTVQLVGAVLLLTNRAPALGFALLAPIVTVIVFFHVFLNPGGLPVAIFLILVSGLVLCTQVSRYASLFSTGMPQRVVSGRDAKADT